MISTLSPTRTPSESLVVNNGVLVVHVEDLNLGPALDQPQPSSGAKALAPVWAVMPLGPHVGDHPLRVGRLITVVRIVAAFRARLP